MENTRDPGESAVGDASRQSKLDYRRSLARLIAGEIMIGLCG
jgi:hypothetical protein